MKTITLLLPALLLGISCPAVAQQDPDDPGIQDSVIVQTVVVESGYAFGAGGYLYRHR